MATKTEEKPIHTPGPWKTKLDDLNFEASHRSTKSIEILTVDEWHICEVHGYLDETEANAKLIAAAPELLEAAEIGLNYVLSEEGRDHKDSDKIKAAIAYAHDTDRG